MADRMGAYAIGESPTATRRRGAGHAKRGGVITHPYHGAGFALPDQRFGPDFRGFSGYGNCDDIISTYCCRTDFAIANFASLLFCSKVALSKAPDPHEREI
jgi:hypothetical protein